ncbi:MAG: thioredoxin domain-containing protein [Candidatus Thorarchaeota archaeon]
MAKKSKKMVSNHLENEKSPYLLQHVNNPVDWYPWGEEAFEKAKNENKPIFLSIGYSTCHWCHVMAHESFEDDEVAALMNDTFVNIKVDREERPDIDKTYMEVAQMMTGRGGWPLTIIMTPEKEPFYADTYIPKQMRYNRPGLMELIPRIRELWTKDRENILEVITQVKEALSSSPTPSSGRSLSLDDIENAFESFSKRFDERKGGFGRAPKFPSPHNILFLLRYWKRTGDKWALHMVEKTLSEMRLGGIYDQIGFGFHRYSTDSEWLLPHFEKMLYDQAMLILAYTEAYQATGKTEYAQVVQEIVAYLKRDMLSPEGAFYSAEDADSEGEEGKFYLWTHQEITEALPENQAKIFSKAFNIRPEGNYMDEATREFTGKNIPHLLQPLERVASNIGIECKEIHHLINEARVNLLERRQARVRPHLDDKILTDWNGLMIAALSKASIAFNSEEYLGLAENAVEFLLQTMTDSNGYLLHRYRDGDAAINGFLDDYAFLIWGLIELYFASFKTEYIEHALRMSNIMLEKFWSSVDGAFNFSSSDSEELLYKQIEAYDGAIPSGNSVALFNFVRLGRMLGDSDFESIAEKIGSRFSETVERSIGGFSMLLAAVDFAIGPTYEVVIAGDPQLNDTQEMIASLAKSYMPNMTILLRGTAKQKEALAKLAPYTKYHEPIKGKATAHVCVEQNCKLPTTEIEKMLGQLTIS